MNNSISQNTPQDNPSHKKHCGKCHLWLAFNQFSPDRATNDGLHFYCKKCRADMRRESCNPENTRDRNYRANYGITAKQYDRMFIEQDGVCASCGLPETRGPQGRNAKQRAGEIANLSVDHDHETGDVRSLLCGDCNTALGQMGEDPERIQKLKDYAEWCKTREPNVKTVQLRLVE